MNQIQQDRLLKLAEHLESGELFHDEFNFNVFHSHCGTCGCALGECPSLWNEWVFAKHPTDVRDNLPVLKEHIPLIKRESMNTKVISKSCQDWFGLDDLYIDILFYPDDEGLELGDVDYESNEDLLAKPFMCSLNTDATRHDVAANIKKYFRIVLGTGEINGKDNT